MSMLFFLSHKIAANLKKLGNKIRVQANGGVGVESNINLPKERSKIKILFLILVCLFIYFFLFGLREIPFYGDEYSLVNYYSQHHWNFSAQVSRDFNKYKYFRTLMFPILFLSYYYLFEYKLLFSVIIVLMFLSIAYGYFYIIGNKLSQKNKLIAILLFIIFLAIPFSLVIMLYRYSICIVLSYLLIGLCVWLLTILPTNKHKLMILITISVLYGISLYLYETALLFPIFFIIYYSSITSKSYDRNKILTRLICFTSFIAITYIILQISNHNPKINQTLMVSSYFSYNPSFIDQLIRKLMAFIYFIKWSFFGAIDYIKLNNYVILINLLLFPSLTGYLLWLILGVKEFYLENYYSKKAIWLGLVLLLCSTGIWSYYWIFKNIFITPPFYHIFYPAVAITLIIYGIVSSLAAMIINKKLFRLAVIIAIIIGINMNVGVLLAQRYSIEHSYGEVIEYANRIDNKFKDEPMKINYLVVMDLPNKFNYDRYVNNYYYMLGIYLKRKNDRWTSIKGIGNSIEYKSKDKSVIFPGGKIVENERVLVLRWLPNNSLEKLDIEEVSKVAKTEDIDWNTVSLGNYRLLFDKKRNGLVLFK